jgi:hypothetical protein
MVSKLRNYGHSAMNCPRCASYMVHEPFEDLRDDTGELYFYGWRCLGCGEIIDPVILANRKNKPAPIESKTRKRLIFR